MDPIDGEIRRALAVDPSPEFLARVRARIAEEPAPGSRRLSWVVVAPAVFAVNHHAAERQHQHCRNGLQHEQRAQSGFRMRGLKHIPCDRGDIHPAANHGDHVGGKDQPKTRMS